MARRTWMPTPTQAENDRAAEGEHVIDKEHDGSPILDDSGRERPPDPKPPDPEPEPEPLPPDISSITPTSAPLPDVELIVYASNYDDSASILFDGAAQPTVHVADGVLRAAISFAGLPGVYDVEVRDGLLLSNAVPFTFEPAPEPEPER